MMLMSPGVSVLAAGLVSGLCFIIINGLRRGRASQSEKDAKEKQAVDKTRCACCLKPFVVGRGVECGECGSRACRKGCSRWDTPDNAWYCLFCHQRRLWLRRNEKWLETFGGLPADHDGSAHCFSTAKSQVFLGGADYAGIAPGVGLAAGGEEDAGDSVERVREFVEKIVDSLVGDVDETPIDRIYDHEGYDQLMENYKEPLAGALARLAVSLQLSVSNKPAADTPTMAHAALRDLVERAVEEARKLPNLGNSDAARSAEPKDISEQTYEDLLATAILNKVIAKYQHEDVDGNSNTLHNSKTSSKAKYITSEIEVGLDEGVEEGSSSLEPLSQDEYSSDCSAPATKYSITRQEPLSLTIEEHIEEVTTTYTSDEEERENNEANGLDFRNAHRVPFPEFGMDIIDPSQESSEETQDEAITPTHVDLVTPIESWEENWLFQKKKMQAQSEPVSMLVPNPSEDFRPLIGDREADDTSDLSDCSAQSDEEIEEELLEAINNVGLKTSEEIFEVKTQISNNVTEVEEVRTRTEFGKTTISIRHDSSVEDSLNDYQIKESDANDAAEILERNGHDEHKIKSDPIMSPSIKLGLEDMLVFHLKDRKSFKLEQEANHHQDHSIEFIEKEKSSVHLVSQDEKTDVIDVKNPEPTKRVGSRVTVKIQSRSETRSLPINTNSVNSYAEETADSVRVEEPEIETNVSLKNGRHSLQLTRDLKPLVDSEEDVNSPQLTRDLKLSGDKDDINVEEDATPSQLTRDLKLLIDEDMENVVNLQQLTRDKNLFKDDINVENGAKLGQVTRELDPSVDESEVSKVENNLQGRLHDDKPVAEPLDEPNLLDDQAVEDLVLVSRDKEDQFVNPNDDLETPELPRTPTSSPLRLDYIVTETGTNIDLHSLDEKLVSIETRTDKLDSLNETVNSYVRRTGEILNSLDSLGSNSSEVIEDGRVEARLIFLGDGEKNSHIVRTELHTIDLQNEDGAQQESEYTEHYATATQRHLDSLTRPGKDVHINEVFEASDDHDDDIPPPIPSTPPPIARLKQCRKASALATVEYEIAGEPQTTERKRVEVDVFLATPPRPGTIAEREHKKWENAAPIENNPYSEENIQKRLWQRQYSRNISSDASVVENSEAPKMSETAMQVVLGAGQPDAKRYGRDYYINDAKKASGVRIRRSAMLNAGRRDSSLSQNSGSYSDDLEPQEQIQYQEPEPISNSVTEVETKVTTWQQNNIDSNYNVVTRARQRVETTIHLGVAPDEVDGNEVKIKPKDNSITEVDNNSWKEEDTDELLENVRRNSKNEMNAKLNNQEDADRNIVLEARNSIVNENRKSINRIDLKAYGFENEIKSNGSSVARVTSKRVVNKLDLKSFGYDSELQRIQSTGHIDAKLNNEIDSKPRIVKMKTKSNLTEHHVEYERSKSTHNLIEYVEASGDFDKTKSTEILEKDKNLTEVFHGFGGMISAKSMPNVAKIEDYSQNLTGICGSKDEQDLIIGLLNTKKEKLREEERLRQEMIKASAKSQGLWKSETMIFAGEKTGRNDLSSEDEPEDIIVGAKSTEILAKQEIFEQTTVLNTSSPSLIDEDLPMPSVRRLAQTFIREPGKKPIAQPRVWNPHGNVKRERPTTPEIHIIETPRQMHSLTARSISREFREGLRQIPNKMSTPTASHIITEQPVNVQNEPELVSSEVDGSINDVDVIAPGKLKNNIKFWEQLQRRS